MQKSCHQFLFIVCEIHNIVQQRECDFPRQRCHVIQRIWKTQKNCFISSISGVTIVT